MSVSNAFKQGFMDAMRKMAEDNISAYDMGRAAMTWPTGLKTPAVQYTGAASNLVDRIGQHIQSSHPDYWAMRWQTDDGKDDLLPIFDDNGVTPASLKMPDDVLKELSIPDRADDGTALPPGARTKLVQKALAPRVDKLVPGTGGNTGYPARYISVPNPLYKTEQP